MRVGKPYLKVIKAAFGFSSRKAKVFLNLCDDYPEGARSLAAEHGKLRIYTDLMGKPFCEVTNEDRV